jgi:hypothetical protein
MSMHQFSAVKSLDINSSSYAGELALPYIAPAILSANTIADNLITVHNNVKYKAVLKKLSNAAEIVDSASCDFDSTANDLDLDEVVLTVTELQVNQQLCKRDFRQDWEALQTGASLMGDRIPPNFETFLMQFLAGKVQENIEKSIWGGNYNPITGATSGTGLITSSFDGICHRLKDGTPGHEVLYGSTEMSASNVLARLDGVIADAPASVLNSADATIYVSRKTQYFIHKALGGITTNAANATAPASGELYTGSVPVTYLGYPIVVPFGMVDETIIFTTKSNLHFGNNLYTDQIEAKLVDMSLTDASDNVRVAMRFSGGTQIGTIGDVSLGRRGS